MKKSYELMVHLVKGRGENVEEWSESTTVEAGSMTEARRLAKEFGRQEAREAGARVEDSYAIDDETGEQSQ